jgi:hypothetical protein
LPVYVAASSKDAESDVEAWVNLSLVRE